MFNKLLALQDDAAEGVSPYEVNLVEVLPRSIGDERLPNRPLRTHQYLAFRLEQEPVTVAHAKEALAEIEKKLNIRFARFGDPLQPCRLVHFVCSFDRQLHAFHWMLSEKYEE